MQKIPKVINYIWFGTKEKSPTILKCIESWKKVLDSFSIQECGNESIENFSENIFFKNAIKEKKWAFASDYARLKILYDEGGIYLDTDMYVLKSFEDFLNYDLVLGKEDEIHISAGMIAAAPKNAFIKKCLEKYETLKEGEYITIPRVLTEVFEDFFNTENNNVKIFEAKYFYPFTAENIQNFNFKNAPKESYAVHLWDFSWGKWYIKLLKKIGLHKKIVKFTEKTGIKNLLKKLFKVI